MKRLVSIMLMNAWGGLRQKASLSTASLLGIGIVLLLGASTVTVSASPDASLPPVVGTVAHIVKSAISTPLTTILNTAPSQKPAIKPKAPAADAVKQPDGTSSPSASAATPPSNSTPSNNATSTQATAQAAAATLTLAALQCNAGQSTYTLTVPSAVVSFQTPTTADGTLSWAWDVRVDSGSNAGQVTAGTATSSPISQGTSSVTLSSSNQPSQWPYTTTSNNTYDYSVRLHITGPVDVTSAWVSVPQSPTGACPQPKQ